MKISFKESYQLKKFTKWFWNKILYFFGRIVLWNIHVSYYYYHVLFQPWSKFYFRSKSEKLSSIRIGDLLTATVKEITDMGAILGKQRLIYFSESFILFFSF